MSNPGSLSALAKATLDRVLRGLCPVEPLAYFPNARYSVRTEPTLHPPMFSKVAAP
ncbi:hypothetical protein [Hoyosella altamirensis]|uniref:Uncharacterized protein n=1 Tax=Hoyosella altamirensis TaxID=616997 RepID=A0A839RRC9_9ACTN|nr:hypothetical protein [Hoyosella altamirensis]MBB3038879.1 hypothetical protein [Hoyosella altamirensis]